MTTPRDRPLVKTGEQSLGMRFSALLFLARATVFWERLWARAWQPVLILATFAAVVLLDLLPGLPGWLHLILLAAFAGSFVVLSYRTMTGFAAVDEATARRRLERDSDLSHRPLSGLADRPVSATDALSLKIWLAHVRSLAAQADRLTLRPPSPGLAARDPYAIRLVVLLALVIGVVAGSGDIGPRLARALTIGGAGDRFAVEIWLTPPTYSRKAPIFLSNAAPAMASGDPSRIDIPTGSTVSVRIAGQTAWYASDPVLEIGNRVIPFDAIGASGDGGRQSFRSETILEGTRDQHLSVRANGNTVATWQLAVLPDLPPVTDFSGPPETDNRSRLEIAYEASDDYAVEDLALEIRLQDQALLAGDQITTIDLPLTGTPSARSQLKGRSSSDLTAHPWAGLPVQLRLLARDGAGQEGASETVGMILPERQFSHPVARAIIEQRRRLALLKPVSRLKIERDVIVGLDLIKNEPLAYEAASTIFLALSVAQARLLHSQQADKYTAVMGLLWDTAISLEEGGLAVAERELEQVREELRQALEKNAEPGEIEKLMDRVARALDNYLMALADKLRAEGGAKMDLDPMMRMLGAGDLKDLLERARDLARTGATDAARQMLSELDRLLESIQGALQQGGAAVAAMNEALKQFGEMIGRARQLAEAQQELLDDIFARHNKNAEKTPAQSQQAAAAQRALRRQLGQLMLDADKLLGAIPPAFGRAERDMTGAAGALDDDHLAKAMGHQKGAVENLRQAVEELTAAMTKMLAGAFGFSPGEGPDGQMPGGRDPFGRMTGEGGLLPGGKIGIPDRGQVHRSRQILDELRRRAGQHSRPKPERDYIDRLLKKF